MSDAGTVSVRLGATREDGIAPAFFALIDRGALHRPEAAAGAPGVAELRFPAEGYPPVRILFGAGGIVVEDADPGAPEPDLIVQGTLPDLVHLTTAPTLRGVPKPTDARGRTALARLARGRIRMTGSRALGRRLLRLLEL